MQMYPFQSDAVRRVFTLGPGRRMLVSPTGTGKSVMLCGLARLHASSGRSVGILVHRIELLEQVAEKLRGYGLRFGIIASKGSTGSAERVQVAMVQTIRRRMDRTPWDVVICDEAHRDEFKIAVNNPPPYLYGFTATPWRADNRLGEWYPDGFTEAIRYSQAIAQGYIVQARVFAPDVPDLRDVATKGGDYDAVELGRRLCNQKLVGNVVDTYLAHGRNEKAVCFCVNVEHANMTTREFQRRGVAAVCVTGDTPSTERSVYMARFRTGSARVLVNVSVAIEGLDVADASIVIIDRPTHSLSMYMQMAGRGARSFPGKREFRLFDHSGSVFEHGSPTQDRDWVLSGPVERRKKGVAAPTFKRCDKCFYVFGPRDRECPNCATPHTTRPVTHKNGQLVEVLPELYKPVEGFVDAFQKARRRAFAETSARGIKGPRQWAYVNRAMEETRAFLRGEAQLIVPQNPDLLW
jgi:superfamily II DNA or RNA helicase